jgi:hypothetical protein
MNTDTPSSSVAPLELSRWRNVPVILMAAGAVGAGIGVATSPAGIKQFAFSWLLAFMFFLSLALGGMFLVMVHHLFDASWSVPTRRFCEHLACLAGWPLLLLFLPIAVLAPHLYEWMDKLGRPDHALSAKFPLFTMPGYYIAAAVCFGVWWLFSNRLRYWSLRQDQTGGADCTHRMRFYSCLGIILFALTLTLAAIMWIKGLMYEWASTMYGVWYFAGSVWTTLATVYVLTMLLQRTTALRDVVRENTYYMIGSLLFAFTVFWAYISFAQYFIIWNANMPEETFWYVKREIGTWWFTGAIILIIGHFFMPFLGLLRIDVKLKLRVMLAICAWAWLMHFVDLEFQIMPSLPSQKDGFFHFTFPFVTRGLLVDVACLMFIGGLLAKIFVASLNRHPIYPRKDPRMAEALGVYVPPASAISIVPGHANEH